MKSAERLKQTSQEKWTMEAPVISTAHITQSAADWLSVAGDCKGSGVWSIFEGWLCSLSALDEKEFVPVALDVVFGWADSQGCEWIRFDPDGDIIKDLPIYEWE